MKKKTLIIDDRAKKAFHKFPLKVREEFLALIEKLEEDGRLEMPQSEKMSGFANLYERRVKSNGQWRGFYSYLIDNFIVMLHFLHKKTQKTPFADLSLCERRLKDYI